MALIVGGALLQIGHLPRLAPESTQAHVAITLPPKACDAYVGDYEFAADNVFSAGLRLTIVRQGDQLVGQTVFKKGGGTAFKLYLESETNFFLEINGSQLLTFIKKDEGEVTGVIHHMAGLPDSEGQKLRNE
jgi:hypothetical protein